MKAALAVCLVLIGCGASNISASPSGQPTASAQHELSPIIVQPIVAEFEDKSTSELCSIYLNQTRSSQQLHLAETFLISRNQSFCGDSRVGEFRALNRRAFPRSRLAWLRRGSADLDCSDFSTAHEAQAYFIAHGGPANDPNRLDGDGDGYACEWGAQVSSHYRQTSALVRQRARASSRIRARSPRATPRVSSGRCHWVNGYTRRNGSYVRGHRRCR